MKKLKKICLTASIACAALTVVAVGITAKTNTPPPAVSCFRYGTGIYAPPDSMRAFSADSYGVIVGTILGSEGQNISHPRLRVTDVLKGRVLHKGDVLQLCSSTGQINLINGNHTVLVFLEGKDHDVWLTNQSGQDVVPQGKDGRFNQQWADGSKTSATADELKRLLK